MASFVKIGHESGFELLNLHQSLVEFLSKFFISNLEHWSRDVVLLLRDSFLQEVWGARATVVGQGPGVKKAVGACDGCWLCVVFGLNVGLVSYVAHSPQ